MFKKSGPKQIAGIVNQLETDLIDAQNEAQSASDAIGASLLGVREGRPGANDTLVKSRETRDRAINNVAELKEAITLAKTRYKIALDHEAAVAKGKCWDEIRTISIKRMALAEEFVSDASDLIAKLDQIKSLGIEMYNLAPSKELQLADSQLSPGAIDNQFRMLLLSKGCSWAHSWPWGETSIPSFLDLTSEAHGWIQKDSKKALVEFELT